MVEDEIEDIEGQLDEFNETLDTVRAESIEELGAESALRFIDVYQQNWIDVAVSWLPDKYPDKFTVYGTDILIYHYLRLFTEIHLLQWLFLRGFYETTCRNLRYILEGTAQAYTVKQRGKNLSLNHQREKAIEIADETHSREIIVPVLKKSIDFDDNETEEDFEPLWSFLCKNIHPSHLRWNPFPTSDFPTHMVTSFFGPQARETLDAADMVFDVVNAVMFDEYPQLVEPATDSDYYPTEKESFPYTARVIDKHI